MNMQTIQLNISNDIFEKVMSFLELLPKNKIDIVQNSKPKKPQQHKESFLKFPYHNQRYFDGRLKPYPTVDGFYNHFK